MVGDFERNSCRGPLDAAHGEQGWVLRHIDGISSCSMGANLLAATTPLCRRRDMWSQGLPGASPVRNPLVTPFASWAADSQEQEPRPFQGSNRNWPGSVGAILLHLSHAFPGRRCDGRPTSATSSSSWSCVISTFDTSARSLVSSGRLPRPWPSSWFSGSSSRRCFLWTCRITRHSSSRESLSGRGCRPRLISPQERSWTIASWSDSRVFR